MRIFCITLGLFVFSFSAAAGGDFVNFVPRAQSPFFPSKGLLLGGSYAGRDGNAYEESEDAYEVVERYIGERARKVIIPKGRYVEVTYRGKDGNVERVKGFVREMDETELTIYQGGLRRRIPVDKIDVLMVGDDSTQLQKARLILATGDSIEVRKDVKVHNLGGKLLLGKKLLFGLIGGATGLFTSLLVVPSFFPEDYCLISISDEYNECGNYPHLTGLLNLSIFVGYGVGVGLGVSWSDPSDSFGHTLLGAVGGGVVGLMSIPDEDNDNPYELLPFIIGPVAGAIIMSELFRERESSKPKVKVRQFSLGLAPDRDGNLLAVAKLRF